MFILSFLLLESIIAQQKILFDVTKAENAGNADWIIDAEQHDLGYSCGYPQGNAGNESNS